MGLTLDIFDDKKPRRKRRAMANISDSGQGMAKFDCNKCGWCSDWIDVSKMSVSAVKNGIPCEKCN